MSDFLKDVEIRSRQRVEVQKRQMSFDDLQKRVKTLPAAQSFQKALNQPGRVTVIAELKQASPSAGVIRKENDIDGRIRGYVKGGAAALSILTEEYYFHGSPQLLEHARKITNLPLLRKDFVVDPYQILESRCIGADAVLLMATLLPGAQLKEFCSLAREIGLDALVEVHDLLDVEAALAADACLIGINHRDLRTLKMDMSISEKLLPWIPKSGKTLIVESGIKEPAEMARYRSWGVHAVLIGETLMRQANPEAAVQGFVQAGRGE